MLARLAIRADLDALLGMGAAGAAEAGVVFDEGRARESFENYLTGADPTVFVVEHRRELLGFLLAAIRQPWFSAGHYASQEVLYVRPEKRGSRAAATLLQAFVQWGRTIGAAELIGGANGLHVDRTIKLLERFGFERVGVQVRLGFPDG